MIISVSVQNAGEIGILKDQPPFALPPNAWTGGQNVRFDDGAVRPAGRELSALGPLQIPPHWNQYLIDHWVYAGEKAANQMGVWTIDSSNTHVELTTGTGVIPVWNETLSRITGGTINGLLVISNQLGYPAYWEGVTPATNKLLHLPWDASNTWSDKNWYARSIRPHKRWLFALGPTEDGDDFPTRIRNSAAAPPDAIPATWDDTDTTNDAAFVDDPAADRYAFVDGMSMGDEFVACTEQTTWIGQATGDDDAPFRFRKVFGQVGVLTTDCMATRGRTQYLLTQDDLVIHDGSDVRSILDRKTRKWLFRNINGSAIQNTFIFYSRITNEIWVCFPELGETRCTRALSVNLSENEKIGIREIPALRHIDMGNDFLASGSLTFSVADFSYGVSNFPYTQDSIVQAREDRFGVSPDDLTGFVCLKHFADDVGPETTPTASVERSYLTFPGHPQLQNSQVLRCTAVYPLFDRAPDGDVNVYVGTARSPGGNMQWSQPRVYNAHTTRSGRVKFREQGPYLGVRFETTDGADWALSGYHLDIVPLGYR